MQLFNGVRSLTCSAFNSLLIEMLHETKRQGPGQYRKVISRGSYLELRDDTPTLHDIGLDKRESALAQKIAALSRALPAS